MYEQTFRDELKNKNLTNSIQAADDDGIISVISSEDQDTIDAVKKQDAGASGDHKNEGHSKAGPPSKWNTRMELEVKTQRMRNKWVCFFH